MILVIGEILFDIFPSYRRLGGAPFNFAFHLKKLGFPVRFFSRVGADKEGRDILNFLKSCGFDVGDIQIDPDYKTGQVTIEIDEKEEHHFYICKNVAYDHVQFTPRLKALLEKKLDLIYFGTLIQRTIEGFSTIQRILSQRQTTTTFCDLNLRPECWTMTSVNASLNQADILKLNHEELFEIAISSDYDIAGAAHKIRSPEIKTPKAKSLGTIPAKVTTQHLVMMDRRKNLFLEKKIYHLFINRLMNDYTLSAVILTHGKEGSEWFTRKDHHKRGPVKIPSVEDTVGAGDAYAAMAAACYLKGVPTENILSLASEFASRICRIKGALPKKDDIYNEFRGKIGRS